MPPAIAAVAVVAAQQLAGYVITSVVAKMLVAVVVSVVVGAISKALTPSPKAPDLSSFQRRAQDNVLTVRQAAATRRVIFGRTRVGGVYTFMHTTGSDNNTLHTVATVAGHPVRSFDALYLGDEVVPLDGSGNATDKYAGKVSVVFGLGTTGGDADFHAALTAAVGSDMWGEDHLQAGCAKAYIKYVYDSDLFAGGLPNPSFVVSGYAAVEDPRFGTSPVTTGFTDNAALCIAQYLRDAARGLGYAGADIDEDALIAAANDCDEMVDRVEVAVTFTAEESSDVLTTADTSAKLRTGTRFRVATTDTLPGGLSAATDYFWIALTPTTGKAAASLADARAQTAVDITSAGSGTHTLTVDGEPRYTLNGWIDTAEGPETVLPRLLAAMAGEKTESGGDVVLLAGVWRAAAETIGDDDLDGPILSSHRRSHRDLFNGVKGVFVNPDDDWQPTDFPVVAPAAYLAEDAGERIWRDAEMSFTDSPSMAQRIARIDLERVRRQQSAEMPLSLAGLKHRAGDTVAVSNTKRGWSAKTFKIVRWSAPEPRDIEGDNPHYGVSVALEETDAAVYAWTPATDESTMTASPLTTLPDPFAATAPTSLVLTSGTDVLGVRLDGTVFSRIKAAWTAPEDAQVTAGGTVEIEYKKSAASAWRSGGAVRGDETESFILDVDDGVAYDVRVRSRRGGALRAASAWVTETAHTVVGKTADPTDVTGFAATQNGTTVNFKWTQVSDRDLAGYEIRYMTAPFVWADAARLTQVTRGTRITTAAVQPSPTVDGAQVPWIFGIKAVDTSGNESATEDTAELTVTNAFTVISDNQQWPLWTGTKTGFVRNPLTGNLNPSSDDSATSVEAFFAAYAVNPPATSSYETAEIDLGRDIAARLWTEATVNLGPGEVGAADPVVEVDTRTDGGAYDGYESWAIGETTLRAFKGRVTADNTDGADRLTGFALTVDSQDRTETGTVNLTGSPAGELAVTFATPFATAPAVRAFSTSASARIAGVAGVTTTGFTFLLWDTSGTPVNDTGRWEAEGV